VQLAHLFLELRSRAVDRYAGGDLLIGSGSTGPAGRPHSSRQPVSWADDTAYTTRPRPIHACAAAHIGQCSPEV